MISLKRTKKDIKKNKEDMAICCEEQESYPWGLSLNLETESLEKLGITELPEVGQELMITAKVKVTRVSQNEIEGEKDRREVALQITDMEFSGAEKKDITNTFYGDK